MTEADKKAIGDATRICEISLLIKVNHQLTNNPNAYPDGNPFPDDSDDGRYSPDDMEDLQDNEGYLTNLEAIDGTILGAAG
jgi:hypothetical protein